jgi:hypothetical protein
MAVTVVSDMNTRKYIILEEREKLQETNNDFEIIGWKQ